MQRNSIKGTIAQYSFRGYNQLQSLRLSGNNIRRISPKAFLDIPSLQLLNLMDNKISTLVEDAFHGLKNLTQLDLRGNKINDIDVNVFQHTPNLLTLQLSRNNILTATIKDDIAKLFKTVKKPDSAHDVINWITSLARFYLPQSHRTNRIGFIQQSIVKVDSWVI